MTNYRLNVTFDTQQHLLMSLDNPDSLVNIRYNKSRKI